MTWGGNRSFALGLLLHVSACGVVARSDLPGSNLQDDSGVTGAAPNAMGGAPVSSGGAGGAAGGSSGGVGGTGAGSGGVGGAGGISGSGGSAGVITSGGAAGSAPYGGLCTSNADCSGSPATPACHTSTGTCVECVPGDASCAAGLYCTASFVCEIGCATDLDCVKAAPPVAGSGSADASTEGGASGVQCDLVLHVCLGCLADADCPNGTICNAATSRCEPGCSASCPSGFDCCASQCVNTLTSEAHCGVCDNPCAARPNAEPECSAGQCVLGPCDFGFADCDLDSANGCEINVTSSTSHCGQCENVCSLPGGASACVSGQCEITECAPGLGDCDGAAANGCEVNLLTNIDHCGVCGDVCQTTGGTPSCTQGFCGNPPCIMPLGDCDGDPSNGCESNMSTSLAHCGGCGNQCVVANGTPGCAAGACYIALCNSGYADCNGVYQDGCEINLLTSTNNCGLCGTVCDSPIGTAYCSGGSCQTP